MRGFPLKVAVSIVTCVLAVLLIISIVNLASSRSLLQKETEEKLFYFVQDYAYQFSKDLEMQEKAANHIAEFASRIFAGAKTSGSRQQFLRQKEDMKQAIKNIASRETNINSIYLTFNPRRFRGNEEIWFVRSDGRLEDESTSAEDEDWLDNSEAASYYDDAIRYGALWSIVSDDPDLKENWVFYSKSIYDRQNRLIGVTGIDISVREILSGVNQIRTYPSGTAMLAEEDGTYITGSLSEQDYLYFCGKGLSRQLQEERPEVLHYQKGRQQYVLAHAQLSNGWNLIVSQPEREVLLPLVRLQETIALAGCMILLLCIIFAIGFSRGKLKPIADEYEKKDIYLHNQARQARMGEMVGNIAHQWKQPLNSMALNLSNLNDDFYAEELTSGEFDGYIRRLNLLIEHMADTIEDFSDFLKPDKEKAWFSVEKELDKVLTLMSHTMKKHSVSVVRTGELVRGFGFRNEFAQVLFNVLSNAAEALEASPAEKREIQITTTAERGGQVKIRVYDNGREIPPEAMERLFEPYYTTKAEKKGTGIGLYMSKEIIETRMDGTIEVNNAAGGVECCLWIPGGREDVLSEPDETALH